MKLFIDLLPKEDGFFISVPIEEGFYLSFDYTLGKSRIIKQKLTGTKEMDGNPDMTWETLEIENGKPKGITKVEWFTTDSEDIINGEVWENVSEKEMPDKIKDRLLSFSSLIYENRDNLDSIGDKLMKLDNYISGIVNDFN